MNHNFVSEIASRLDQVTTQEENMKLRTGITPPSDIELGNLIQLLQAVIFPGFFKKGATTETIANIDNVLTCQVARALAAHGRDTAQADHITTEFVQSLPDIKHSLLTDIEAIAHNDPAVRDFTEVICSYPIVKVMIHYRIAHRLLELGVPIIPRMLTEIAHSATGIDIHPAAQIGDYFCIDHGTGVVIGATTIIGKHVMLYQGVTLGAKNFRYDEDGAPIDEPRHPIVEDNVTIYSNASLLGRITIGHDTTIGGNVWLTHSVPPFSKVLQGKAIEMGSKNQSAQE